MLFNYFTREDIDIVREKTTIKLGEIYSFKVKAAEEKHWPDGNSSISLQLIPMTEEVEFPIVFEMISNNTKNADAMEKNLDFFESINKINLLKSGNVSTVALVGAIGKAIFYQNTYNGKTQVKVEKYIPMSKHEFNDDINF